MRLKEYGNLYKVSSLCVSSNVAVSFVFAMHFHSRSRAKPWFLEYSHFFPSIIKYPSKQRAMNGNKIGAWLPQTLLSPCQMISFPFFLLIRFCSSPPLVEMSVLKYSFSSVINIVFVPL